MDRFIAIFADFVEHGINFNVEHEVFCVHYLFIPVINLELEKNAQAWNMHQLRTEHQQTPLQLLELHKHLIPPAVGHAPQAVAALWALQDEFIAAQDPETQLVMEPVEWFKDPAKRLTFQERVQPLELGDLLKDNEFMFTRVTNAIAEYLVIASI